MEKDKEKDKNKTEGGSKASPSPTLEPPKKSAYQTLSFKDYLKYNSNEDDQFGYVYGNLQGDISTPEKKQQAFDRFDKDNTQRNADFRNKYGEFAANREWWGGYVKQVNPIDKKPISDLVKGAAKKVGVDPGLLFSNAMEEGMAMYQSPSTYKDYVGDEKYPISGFFNYGLDFAGEEIPKFIEKGLLPKDFKSQYTIDYQTNERGEKVPAANFKNNEAALATMAAMIKDRSEPVEKEIKKIAPNMSERARNFFYSAAYNMNPTNAKFLLQYLNNKGLLKDDKFLDTDLNLHDKKTYSDIAKYLNYPKIPANKTIDTRLANMYIFARRRADALHGLKQDQQLNDLYK